MSKLRTYAYMNKRSQKVKDGEADFQAVYREVDARSEGRCEVNFFPDVPRLRCTKRATDRHHLFKPRRSFHEAALIVALCRGHHSRVDWPYKRGRLVFSLDHGLLRSRLVFAADKFALRVTTG